MNKRKLPLILSCLLIAFLPGCGTLDPAGPYAGDKVLYDADLTITTAYDVMDTFVTWEYQNRAALASKPNILATANKFRTQGRQWISTAIALRDAYAADPAGGTRTALQSALATLRAAMTEATKYLAESKGFSATAPPPLRISARPILLEDPA